MFMSTLDLSSQLQSHISNCPLNTSPWVFHSQLQLNPRACFAFSFLHLGKWQVHPLSCSNTKHDSWFPFLLLAHPTENPSEDSVGCIFKIHPGSDHFLLRLSIYRSRPLWFFASHQCNCLLIAFLTLQSKQNIFFSSWVISWLTKLTLYQVLYTVIYIHHLFSKCMPPKCSVCIFQVKAVKWNSLSRITHVLWKTWKSQAQVPPQVPGSFLQSSCWWIIWFSPPGNPSLKASWWSQCKLKSSS